MLILLAAAVVAGVAGVLAHAGAATVPNAIPTGGAAFAGIVVLLLGLAHFLSGGRADELEGHRYGSLPLRPGAASSVDASPS